MDIQKELLETKRQISIDIILLKESLTELEEKNTVKILGSSLITIINRCEYIIDFTKNSMGIKNIANQCIQESTNLLEKIGGRYITKSKVDIREISLFEKSSNKIIKILEELIKEIDELLSSLAS